MRKEKKKIEDKEEERSDKNKNQEEKEKDSLSDEDDDLYNDNRFVDDESIYDKQNLTTKKMITRL